jgi:hypothetical protein
MIRNPCSVPFTGTGVIAGSFPPSISSSLSVSTDGLTVSNGFTGLPLVINGYNIFTDEPYCPTCGDPVNLANGSLWRSETDFAQAELGAHAKTDHRNADGRRKIRQFGYRRVCVFDQKLFPAVYRITH